MHNAVRGDRRRLPPRRARLRAALGAGSAHIERRERRGHAERPARGTRRRRAPGRLLVLDVGLRLDAHAADDARTTPPDPISPYGVAKLAAERYCISFSRVYESFETVVLRYFNVFGPRQSPYSQYAAVDPALRHRDRSRRADRRSTATASSRATSPTSATSSTRRSAPATPTERAARSSTSPRASPASVNQHRRHDRRDPRQARGAPSAAAARGGHPQLVGRPVEGRADPRVHAGDRPRGRPPANSGVLVGLRCRRRNLHERGPRRLLLAGRGRET